MTHLHVTLAGVGTARFEQDYLYSSGIDYYGNRRGLIDINYLYGEESGDSSLFENL